ncbi:MAG TPA: hypothetical protein VEA92_00025 [Candidatus Paceibacterota bacterium]|nr:hypothetical protein [Candidatus Paceibacterota bacterium]
MFVSIAIVSAIALTAGACVNPNGPKYEQVDVRYIVTDAPFTRDEDCFLRVRREDEPQTAPSRLLRYWAGPALRACMVHRKGDLLIRTESVLVPSPVASPAQKAG